MYNVVEGGLLTHAMEGHYCGCIIEGGLLTHAMEAHLLWLYYRGWPANTCYGGSIKKHRNS